MKKEQTTLPGCEQIIEARKKARQEEKKIKEFLEEILEQLNFPKTREYQEKFRDCVSYKSFLKKLEKVAGEKQLEFPEGLKQRIRFWTGEASANAIKKTPNMKVQRAADPTADFLTRIHLIPLSLKGYTKTKEGSTHVWEKETLRGKQCLYIPDPAHGLKPAAGDLAKRALKVVCLFAAKRNKANPGPIKFGDLLEQLGQEDASQETRKRLKDYLEAFGMTGVLIKEFNPEGREIRFEYAPYFSNFIWDGKIEKTAEIFPTLNKDLFKMLSQNRLLNYSYMENVGRKKLPGMKDRDALAQDMFLKLKGLKVRKYKMRNFLHRFGNFGPDELKRRTVKEIEIWVNKNIEIAKKLQTVKTVKVHNHQKKSTYLEQVISIYPGKWDRPQAELSEEVSKQIEEIIEWIHDPENRFYAKTTKERNREALQTMFRIAGDEFWADVLVEFEAACSSHENGLSWYPDHGEPGQSAAMLFWDNIREIYARHKNR